jgi:4-amino-4-deoxy-L-arabinose transferase-like glycosyltransferase
MDAGKKPNARDGLVIAALSFVLLLDWAFTVRPLNAPDEPAHLQAVMELRERRSLPEIHFHFIRPRRGRVVGQPGSSLARAYISSLGIKSDLVLTPYESVQPPLYYLCAALASTPLPPDPKVILYLSRLVAAIFGAGTVYFAWAAVKQFAPNATMWATATAGLIALLPQFCFNSATASNDSAATFASTAALYVWFRGLRQPGYDPWLLKAGALAGLGTLAKLTALCLYPGLGVLLLFRVLNARSGGPRRLTLWKLALAQGAGAALGALAVCGWWLLRNMLTYGELSGSLDTLQFYQGLFQVVHFDNPALVFEFLRLTWMSTLGFFGWLSVPLNDALHVATSILVLCLLAVTAYAAVIRMLRSRKTPPRSGANLTAQMIVLMVAASAALLASYLVFNGTVAYQPQARYLFPMLLPAAMLLTGGIDALVQGRKARVAVFSGLLLWFAYLNATGLVLASGPRIWP